MNLFSAFALLRPLLFSMDPESAHNFTLRALDRLHKLGLLPASTPLLGRTVSLAGLSFKNPIGLAAGLDKNAAHLDALGAFGFGFIEVGTVTPRPQPGNPLPRMFRLPDHQAIINRLGFNNLGLRAFISNVERSRWAKEKRGVLGLNIGKNANTPIERAEDDYIACLEGVYPWADYITVNISSPNTKNLRDLQQDTALDRLLERLKNSQRQLILRFEKTVPLFLKIAPDLDDTQIEQIARQVRHQGFDGVIATNTTLNRTAVAQDPNAHEAGGLSGGPLREQANHVVATLRKSLGPEFPIIGVGGVLNGSDAQSKLAAGADLVQLYTGLIYRGPPLVAESVRATRSA